MVEIIPPGRDVEPVERRASGNGGGGGTTFVAVGNLHYHGNDLTEFRKLAETSPELAAKVLEQRDGENSRSHVSYRFGLAVSVALLIFILTAFSYLLVHLGVVSTLVTIVAVLTVALLVRVVLTGQWSDTSLIGRLVGIIARALGSTA